jgi:hypothetical protein
MHPDIVLALKIQDLDIRSLELRREIAALPKHIAEIEKALDSHNKRLELDKAKSVANQRERKQLDTDIQTQQQKISKLKDQMLQAKTNEQYRAFQHEIEFCEKEIRKAEDKILDLMSEAEPLDANVKSAEKALAEEKKVVEAEKKLAMERTNADKADLAAALKEREVYCAQISKPVLAIYEAQRKKHANGVAVSEAAEGMCIACRMLLRPQFFQDLKTAESPMQCENCRRLLYIQPKPIDVAVEMS